MVKTDMKFGLAGSIATVSDRTEASSWSTRISNTAYDLLLNRRVTGKNPPIKIKKNNFTVCAICKVDLLEYTVD